MAEIKIEKKKPIWPWIILVLVILAILYFLVFADDGDDDDIDDVTTEQVEEETTWEDDTETTTWEEESDSIGQGVQSYLTYISDESKMGIDHEYTNNALIELMNAVQAKADDMNYDISADMESVRMEAKKITEDPMATTHANTIKSAGTKLANILQKMQQEKFPNLNNDVQEVMTAAKNIKGSEQTLNQKDQVNKFFNKAGDLLRKMS
jgi:hypothetical protein